MAAYKLSSLFIFVTIACGVAAMCRILGVINGLALAFGIAGLAALGYAAFLVCWKAKSKGILYGMGGLALLFLSVAGSSQAIGVGTSSVAFKIEVTDAATGLPIENAAVRLLDLHKALHETPLPVTPQDDIGVESFTLADGRSELIYEFTSSSKWHSAIPWDNGQTHIFVGYDYWLEVSAEGYEIYRVYLPDLYGSGIDQRRLPLPPIRVKLRKE